MITKPIPHLFVKSLFALAFIFIFTSANFAFAQHTLTVKVTNLKSDKGTVMIALYKGENGFPKDDSKAIRREKVTIKNGIATIIFKDLPSGDYAFAMFHDENGNNEMDSNMFGIPKEGYAFSTNYKPKISAPDFDEADFKISGNTTQNIKMIN